jgi:hypothetical protein
MSSWLKLMSIQNLGEKLLLKSRDVDVFSIKTS